MVIEYPCLQPFHEDIFKETISDPDISEEMKFVLCFFEEWTGNLVHPVGDDLYHADRLESILYCYMASQSLTFDWLSHALLLGNYETVLRELRCLLENMFLTFSLDIHHEDKTVKDKYEILRQWESSDKIPHGKSVFKKSEYPDWQRCYVLYKDLCKYIHMSTESAGKSALEIATRGFPEALDTKYSQSSFLRCSQIWRQIAIIAVSLVECLFQKLQISINNFDPSYFYTVWGS